MSFYENESAKENRIIGRSYLLPSVSASYSAKPQRGRRYPRARTTVGSAPSCQREPPALHQPLSVVQLRQPILNLDGIARYRQGKVQAAQGEARSRPAPTK
jgi:protease secretion system outer membrane protein